MISKYYIVLKFDVAFVFFFLQTGRSKIYFFVSKCLLRPIDLITKRRRDNFIYLNFQLECKFQIRLNDSFICRHVCIVPKCLKSYPKQ